MDDKWLNSFDEENSGDDGEWCVRSADTGKDMRDCCSNTSIIMCNVLATVCFIFFIFSVTSFLFALRRHKDLSKEKLLLGLYVSISLSLVTRAVYFLNFYFHDMRKDNV